ncbi:MAG TPA: DUF1702 family protein [Ktedonobacteraceae bacterium]|jgi:hypothetical protein
MSVFGNLLRPLFGVTAKDTSFSQRDRQAAGRLKTVVNTVTKGCQLTLQNSNVEKLVGKLDAFDPELRGFAYEGAGIGLAALDCLLPWKNRVRAFLAGPGSAFIYAVPLGAGMALARLHRRPEPFLKKRLDPLMGWVLLDGYGFHEGFFARRRAIGRQQVPQHLSAYGRRVFDHGVGRSIWFSGEASVAQVQTTIAAFPPERQADLWRGVGLAVGYTGGVERPVIAALLDACGPHRAPLALGIAVAANARHSVGNPSPNADLASETVWGLSSQQLSQLVEQARADLPPDGEVPAYEIWRQRIEAQFAGSARQVPAPEEVSL